MSHDPIGSTHERVRAALLEHLPGYEPQVISVIPTSGPDLFVEVDGSLVIELPAVAGPAAARRLPPSAEATLVRSLGGLLDVAVPVPVFDDDPLSVRAHRKTAGDPLPTMQLTVQQGLHLARRLGGMLADLHGVDASATGVNLPIAPGPAAHLAAAVRSWSDHDAVDEDPQWGAAVAEFLQQPAPDHPPHPSLCHLDLRPPNILVDEQHALTGVLGWSHAAIGDPARDLGSVLLHLGEDALDAALDGYRRAGAVTDDDPDLLVRIVFHARCSALEELDAADARSVFALPE